MAKAKNPPWLMWGSSQSLPIGLVSGATPQAVTTAQLAAIDYGRPDSWRFMLFGAIRGITTIGVGTFTVTATFDLTLGLGRSVFTLNGFEQFIWVNGEQNKVIYSTEVKGPTRFTADAVENLISEFPAQTIQAGVRFSVAVTGSMAVTSMTLELGAFFAPKTHVRPDWYSAGALGSMEQ